MKFSLSWLLEYIDLEMPSSEIGKILTLAGIEVEGIEVVEPSFEKVVVGKVLQVEKHPNADKLCVATVSDGKEQFQVVCGAPNCRSGMKTAFAKTGAVLKDSEGKEFTVKKTKLRGVESEGMLCSAKELKIGEDADGIMELSEYLNEGEELAPLYSDTIFEVGLTPNLGHCASIIGIARELSAITGKPVRYPEINVVEDRNELIEKAARVQVKAPKACPRYAAREIKDVKIGPSPAWMQKRLLACGQRPVNNVVDIVNYVVLEFGHPLHAFDYDRVEGHEVVVREADQGEKFVTLDDKERELQQGDLLICDREKPVALAGIMGGLNSEVSEKTRNVLLEAAYFSPSGIRKTSKRLGLFTDASKRYERGTDPNQVLQSMNRASELLQKIAGGKVLSGYIDIKASSFPEKRIGCRLERVNAILGTKLSVGEVENIFLRLGMKPNWDGQSQFLVTVPTYRTDITQEIDLIEEVARIYGYGNIEQHLPRFHSSVIPSSDLFLFEREIKFRLIAEGLQEFISCDLIGPLLSSLIDQQRVPESAFIKVLNPTSIEQSILRASLMPSFLQAVKYNIDHQSNNIAAFEVGRIHFKDAENYLEQPVVAIVLSGQGTPPFWSAENREVDFYDLKGILENLLTNLQMDGNISFRKSKFTTLHPGRQASVYVGDLDIGIIGEVHPSILKKLDIQQRVFFAELSLQDLLKHRKKGEKMNALPLYPSSSRDWTVTVKETHSVQSILDAIRKESSKLLESAFLVTIYRSDKLGSNLKNVTFHFVYRDRSKTVEQEFVDAEHARIVGQVQKTFEEG